MSGNVQVNSDGLVVRFGRAQGDRGNKGSVTTSTTKYNEWVARFTLTGAARTLYSTDRNNDATLDGFSLLDTPLPAGALILDQQVIVLETPAGGTNYAVGGYQINGTAIDADGIRKTDGTDGDQVGTVLAAANFVTAVTTGTYTAGIVEVIITYLVP